MTGNTPKRRRIEPVGPNGIVDNWSSNGVNVYKTEYIWIISEFSFQYSNIKTLKSSTFTSDFNGSAKCKWYLELCQKKDDPDFVSLYLHLDPKSLCTKTLAKIRLSVMTSKQTEMYISNNPNIREFIAIPHKCWGYDDFLSKKLLFDEKDYLLPDDKLTIFCEITHYIPSSTSNQLNSVTAPPFVSNINRLSEDLGSALKSSKFADVTIKVNGTEYPVHRTILAARSAVFSAMFEPNGMQESENNRIDVTDIREDVMEEMLRYIYTGNVGKLDELADDLFKAADKYDLGELKALCEIFLNDDLSVDNAASTLALADLHRAYDLKSKTMDYIVLNFNKVKDTEGWKTLAGSRNDLLNEVCQAFSRKVANK